MKNLKNFCLLFFVLATATACNKLREDERPDVPVIQQDPYCLCNSDGYNSHSRCQNDIYNQGYGFQPYPNYQQFPDYQYNNYCGFYAYSAYYQYQYQQVQRPQSFQDCFCPYGMRAVYSAAHGLGCVDTYYVTPDVVLWNIPPYSYRTFPSGPSPHQIPNFQYPYASSNSCFNSMPISCAVDYQNSCGSGYSCVPTAGGSRIGLCVRNGYNGGRYTVPLR